MKLLLTCAALLLVPTLTAQTKTMQQQVLAAETSALDHLKNGDYSLFADMLDPTAIFVDAAGQATKQQVVRSVANFKLSSYTIESPQFQQLSPTSGLISYKITETGTSRGRELTARVYISSIWSNASGHWQCTFSQESVAPPQKP
jgi:hypothetical protein